MKRLYELFQEAFDYDGFVSRCRQAGMPEDLIRDLAFEAEYKAWWRAVSTAGSRVRLTYEVKYPNNVYKAETEGEVVRPAASESGRVLVRHPMREHEGGDTFMAERWYSAWDLEPA